MATTKKPAPARSQKFFEKLEEGQFQLQSRYGGRAVSQYVEHAERGDDGCEIRFSYEVEGGSVTTVVACKISNMDGQEQESPTFNYLIKIIKPGEEYFMYDHWNKAFAQLNQAWTNKLKQWKASLKAAKQTK